MTLEKGVCIDGKISVACECPELDFMCVSIPSRVHFQSQRTPMKFNLGLFLKSASTGFVIPSPSDPFASQTSK